MRLQKLLAGEDHRQDFKCILQAGAPMTYQSSIKNKFRGWSELSDAEKTLITASVIWIIFMTLVIL
jgi:hypothetical protein